MEGYAGRLRPVSISSSLTPYEANEKLTMMNLYLRGQIIWLFIPIAIETFHVPIQLWLYTRNLLHPIAALVLSFCFMGLWVSFSVLAPLIDACVEQKFPDAWYGLFWARQVTGYLITLLYLAYFGFSCAAVHNWRSGKKAVDGTSSDGDIEMKA